MQSWTWPDGPECIAEVFLAQGWAKNTAKVDLNDLSTALSLWNNCTIYDIQLNTLKKLREVRNSFFAHNSKLEVSDDKLTTIFMVLGVLFRDGDLTDFIDENKSLQDLENIKQKKDKRFNDLLTKIDIQSDKLDEVILYIRKQGEEKKDTIRSRYSGTIQVLAVLFIIFLLTLFILNWVGVRRQSQHGTDPGTNFTHRKSTYLI